MSILEFFGLVSKSKYERDLCSLLSYIDKLEDKVEIAEFDARIYKAKAQIFQRQSTKPVGTSEAQEAFEPFRKKIAKNIVSIGLTTENALEVARNAFIAGFKQGRQ